MNSAMMEPSSEGFVHKILETLKELWDTPADEIGRHESFGIRNPISKMKLCELTKEVRWLFRTHVRIEFTNEGDVLVAPFVKAATAAGFACKVKSEKSTKTVIVSARS